jgi:hypothetical protein
MSCTPAALDPFSFLGWSFCVHFHTETRLIDQASMGCFLFCFPDSKPKKKSQWTILPDAGQLFERANV